MRRWGPAGRRASTGQFTQGWSWDHLVCDQTHVSASGSLPFLPPTSFWTFLLASPTNNRTVCPVKIMKRSKSHRPPGGLVLSSQAASYFLIASRAQAVACIWINSPVFFNASAIARACRCHPVRHLSGPELPAADGGPPRAGRRVAVPAEGRIPDRQRQGRPAALLSDGAAHLRATAAGSLQEWSLQNLMRLRLQEI